MQSLEEQAVDVVSPDGIEQARRVVRQFSRQAGLPVQATEELVLATSELATNLTRHATGGRVVCSLGPIGERPAVEVRCIDSGPGIANVNNAMVDGFSTTGGLGGGLSSAQSLCDEFLIESTAAATVVRIRKWLPQS